MMKRSTHADCPACLTNLSDYGQKACEACGLVFAGHELFAKFKSTTHAQQRLLVSQEPEPKSKRARDDSSITRQTAKPVSQEPQPKCARDDSSIARQAPEAIDSTFPDR